MAAKLITPAMRIICRREFSAYFTTPLAYIFLVMFLLLANALTFFMGGLLGNNQASLGTFFTFHPWLYLLFLPALTMRLWAEERQSGTIELLMTMPITALDAVLGKFLACWKFAGVALLLTTPLWITINYLGEPDNGVVLASYLASWLMAGGFIAIGGFCSACTKNQVIAYTLAVVLSFIFVVGGTPIVLNFFTGWAPSLLTEAVAGLSMLSHYQYLSQGLLAFKDVAYFLLLMLFFVLATMAVVDQKKAS